MIDEVEAPATLHDVCEQALALDIQDQYVDCGRLREDLQKILDELSASFSSLNASGLSKNALVHGWQAAAGTLGQILV